MIHRLRVTGILALVSFVAACSDAETAGLPRAFEGALVCGRPAAAIHTIQGRAEMSPAVGRQVEVEGVLISRTLEATGGFFMQTEPALEDHDPATSEALFVRYDEALPHLAKATRVRVRGRVAELGPAPESATALIEVSALIACGEAAPVPVTVLSSAPSSSDGWERYENQRLRLPGPLSVIGNARLLDAGELLVSLDGRDFVGTELALPGSAAAAIESANQSSRLLLDAGPVNGARHRWWFLPEQLSADAPWRVDSAVRGAEGILQQRDGQWRLRLLKPIASVSQAARPQTPPELDADRSIVSFNVENFFNGDGLGAGFPTARGAHDAAALARQRSKMVAALVALHADVLALMEVENDGFGPNSALPQLVTALNAAIGAPAGDYQMVRPPESDRIGDDAITVAILYRQSRVQPVGAAALLQTELFKRGRTPLAQTFRAEATTFTVIANHFKSKGGCATAIGTDQEQADAQGCFNATRVAMAKQLLNWIGTDPTAAKSANTLIVGDLNAYGHEAPVRLLIDQGWHDLVAEMAAEPAYSYVYNGGSGRLDHALASTGFAKLVSASAHWHINADESAAFGYVSAGASARALRERFRPDPFRSSDHDPLLIGIKLR